MPAGTVKKKENAYEAFEYGNGGKENGLVHSGIKYLDADEYKEYAPVVHSDSYLNRSNQLIFSKYRSSNAESKLLVLTLYSVQKSRSGMTAEFTVSQLREALGLSKWSAVYTQIRDASANLIDHKFIIEDREQKAFAMYSLVEYAKYSDGVLRIKLSESAMQHITSLKKNYTSMQLPILLSLGNDGKQASRTNFTFRIYELLRTQLYRCTSARPKYRFSFSLPDLKITIGCVDIDDPGIRNGILKHIDDPEFVLEKYADRKESTVFARYTDFDKRVLKRAQAEINDKTDLAFDYKPVRTGRGGRVTSIIFTIWRNPNYRPAEQIETDYTLISAVRDMIEEPIKQKSIIKLLTVSGNDLEKIRNAYVMAKAQKTEVRNLVGWMIKAIQEQWNMEDTVNVVPRQKGLMYEITGSNGEKKSIYSRGKYNKKKNPFNNFEQHTYDFEQLEMDLLSRDE